MGRSSLPGADYAQVILAAHGLHSKGCRLGVALILFNAEIAAQREAAQVSDLPQRPSFGRIGKPQPHPAAANDHQPASQPAPLGTGL